MYVRALDMSLGEKIKEGLACDGVMMVVMQAKGLEEPVLTVDPCTDLHHRSSNATATVTLLVDCAGEG